MTPTISPSEAAVRTEILARSFALLERPFDEGLIRDAVMATVNIPLPAFTAACNHLVRAGAKGPVVAAINQHAMNRDRHRGERGGAVAVVPYVHCADERAVQLFAKPAGHQWECQERAMMHADLGLEVPEFLRRELKMATFRTPPELGEPPDPDSFVVPNRARRTELNRQLMARLARHPKKGMTPAVPGMSRAGVTMAKDATAGRTPGEEG